MPSARMQKSGYANAMYASLPPYQIFSLSFQLFDRLELSGNYWVFTGIEDTFLGKDFGDSADRAGNFRFSLINAHHDYLPEVAIGANDFFGSKRFSSTFLVATKQFYRYGLECSLGYGLGRINGFFSGISYSPFSSIPLGKNLSFILEYDANDYRNHTEEHPEGRNVQLPINFGVNYSFKEFLSAKVSTIRGNDLAFALSLQYNIGQAKPLLSKKKDPLYYSTPIDHEPIGLIRKDKIFAQDLAFAFQKQGLVLYSAKTKKQTLFLKVINQNYRKEWEVKRRIDHLLKALVPLNYRKIIVTIESAGIYIHQYHYNTKDLLALDKDQIPEKVFCKKTLRKEVEGCENSYNQICLYQRKKSLANLLIRPRLKTLFGSTKGKIKYDLSAIADLQGYLGDQIFYQCLASYTISSSMQDLGSCDKLNPSQIINVRTDRLEYHKANSFHIEKLYAQKGLNLGKGFFSRFALGYFESAYAGGCLEFLYYPVRSRLAVGVEIALLKKRNFSGMGFTDTIRKYKGFCPEEIPFPYALQFFLDLYYQYPKLLIDTRISIGQFLAKDKGIRLEWGKNFYNGVRVFFWTTFTNGHDEVNGSTYYDKGIGFSIPLELISYKSSKKNLGYSMSAWLRDVGARSKTGKKLYPVIHQERNFF